MAFLKKKSRLPALFLKGLLIIVMILAFLGGLFYLYQRQLNALKAKHDEEIQKYQFELYQLARQVMVPIKDIEYGTVLACEMFQQVTMKLDITQASLLDESDMGKVNMIALPAGIPVIKSTVTEEQLANDLRRLEFNMFLIQTNQIKGDYIDVRIVFPNGENYIVLGKKQIKDIQRAENILWLWLDETEIHLISSAIIDAYLHPGTKITVSTYIQPEIQLSATPYYPANADVLDLMRKDPNILQKASDSLAREARALLESHLEALTMEEMSKVSSGVNEEVSKTNEMIKNEELQQARQEKEQEQDQKQSEHSKQNISPKEHEIPVDPYN